MKPATPLLLYIDDDADLARLVERGLKRQGFAVEHAADGASGLARIKQGGIDVVALDQHMPGLDGLETLAEIQKIPDAPPVIFVTASQDSKIAVTALKAGSADYLVKDTQGEFLALLDVAAKGAIEQALVRKARDDAEAEVHASRDRYAALAAEREVPAARSQPPGRQQLADHRIAAAPSSEFEHGRRCEGRADKRDGPRRGCRAGSSPPLHVAGSQDGHAEPVP